VLSLLLSLLCRRLNRDGFVSWETSDVCRNQEPYLRIRGAGSTSARVGVKECDTMVLLMNVLLRKMEECVNEDQNE
jgi:hypothetical protein